MNAPRQAWDALDHDVPVPACAQTSHTADRGFQQNRSWLEHHWTLAAQEGIAAIPEMSLTLKYCDTPTFCGGRLNADGYRREKA